MLPLLSPLSELFV